MKKVVFILLLVAFTVCCAEDGGSSSSCKTKVPNMDCIEFTQGEVDALMAVLPVELVGGVDTFELDVYAEAGEIKMKTELEKTSNGNTTGRKCEVLD